MPSPSGTVQVTGGAFTLPDSTVLASGYLLFSLSHDARSTVAGTQVVSGITQRVALNSSGSIPSSPATYLYYNSGLEPDNTYYIVRAFAADGTEAWNAPQYWIIPSSPDPFDVGTLIPANPPGPGLSLAPSVQVTLETDSVLNDVQDKLNLIAGSNVNLSESNGDVTISATSTAISLSTDGVANTSQTALNLQSGTGISLSNPSAGNVTISSTAVAASAQIWGIPNWSSPSSASSDVPNSYLSVTPAHLGAGLVTTVVAPTSTQPSYLRLDESAGSPNNVCFTGLTTQNIYLRLMKVMKQQLFTFATTNLRYWIGLTDFTTPYDGTFESNTPAANFIGFRYTNGTDSSWTAVCQTDATHQTTASTGVAVNTSGAKHTFEIRTAQGIPGTILFYIDSAQVTSISTNVPSSTLALAPLAYSESTTGVSVPSIGANLFYFEFFQ